LTPPRLFFSSGLAQSPLDPATGAPIERAEARMALLVETLEKAPTRIIIPTSVMSELLVYAGAATAELDRGARVKRSHPEGGPQPSSEGGHEMPRPTTL
jgi:hypothetical protein